MCRLSGEFTSNFFVHATGHKVKTKQCIKRFAFKIKSSVKYHRVIKRKHIHFIRNQFNFASVQKSMNANGSLAKRLQEHLEVCSLHLTQ